MDSWKLVKWLVLITVIILAGIIASLGWEEESLRITIRLSARISGVLFALAFGASSFRYFIKGDITQWILTNRKYLGVSFAIVHLIHLLLLVFLQYFFHPVFERAAASSLIGGGMAYFFAVAMLETSFSRFADLISQRSWQLLHLIGGYWIWFIYFKGYWKRVTTELEYLPLVVLLGIVLLLRIGKVFRQKLNTQ
jgi:hypothetical protein